MHNTLNKCIKKTWNDNWILIFICFVGRLLLESSTSSSSSFIIALFLIKMLDRFFKSWVLHIPQRLRDLLWMVRAWCFVAPIFSSLLTSRASSSSQSLLKVITSFWHTFLAWMNSWSWEAIQGGHYHFCILHFFFPRLKLLFDLWLHGLYILDLHILQLVS